MERVLVLVVAALAIFSSAAAAESHQDKAAKTVGDVYSQRYLHTITNRLQRSFMKYVREVRDSILSSFVPFYGDIPALPMEQEILYYILNLEVEIMSAFASDLSSTTLQLIYKDLNDNCAGSLEAAFVDLTVKPSNVTCVSIRLRKMLRLMLRKDIGVALQKLSYDCAQQKNLPLCKKVSASCTRGYEDGMGKLLDQYVQDARELGAELASTPLDIIVTFIDESCRWIMKPLVAGYYSMTVSGVLVSLLPSSIEPFTLENAIAPRSRESEFVFFRNEVPLWSTDQSAWGIVKKEAVRFSLPCSDYRDIYSHESEQYLRLLQQCYSVKTFGLSVGLLFCAYRDGGSTPLTWSTVSSAYFHSHCLCLAFNGSDCGVNAPQGVDPRLYCLSVLLRDFQRQATYRPDLTYLDYSFQTRVPVCQFSDILQVDFHKLCDNYRNYTMLPLTLSLQCYFKDLVNKQLNCSESLILNTYNETVLCSLLFFVRFVACDCDGDVDVPLSFYRAGDSPLVHFVTYGDVTVRVLTLVTYMASPQLRNLPGKLLTAYLATALLRLVVVRATLADMALTVRLDVATDLASTLWLTAYLHFLTVCIRDLRPPDSLSHDEARSVLLRSSLLGWVLPGVLSVVFFSIDEAIDSHVQIGQLLFLLCNYVALFSNLYMCFINYKFYYDVKKNARKIKQGARKRDVFATIFNFAIKTSILSGAGIIFRLIFTQLQGLEELLGYSHVLGTLQGFLVFLLYGCNHEARDFWLQVVRSTLSRFRRPRQNAPV